MVGVPDVTAHVASNLDQTTRFGFDMGLSNAYDGTASSEATVGAGPLPSWLRTRPTR